MRDRLAAAGYFGTDALADDVDLQATHHVKFVPGGVLADGRLVTAAELARLLAHVSRAQVTVIPGYDIRNGRRVAEPFVAEDPDYDLQLSHGRPLRHLVDSDAIPGTAQDIYQLSGEVISPREYARDRAAPPERVPPGRLFVVGDNRNDSNDSALWGFLPSRNVIGQAALIFFPRMRSLR